VCHLSFK